MYYAMYYVADIEALDDLAIILSFLSLLSIDFAVDTQFLQAYLELWSWLMISTS